jgi:hypothetical protein
MPSAAVLGPLGNIAVPFAHGQLADALSKMDPVLALPSKREAFDPNSAQVKTYNSKQEVFNNQSVYLETFFEGALFETPNTFVTDLIFPFRRYDDINFAWDYYYFPLFPAVRTAQLAPPVKLGFSSRRGEATMSRYALSVEGLTEDQRSNLGKTMMTGLLSSLAHGFLSMFELNGFRALFREPATYQRFFFEAQLYDQDPKRQLLVELSHFDILRRNGTGFQNLTNDAQQEVRDTQQLRLTYAIIPPGSRSIFARSPEMRFYNLRGDGSQSLMDLQGDAPELQNTFAGVRLLVARPYYFDGAGVTVSPMERHIMIGDFGIQDNIVDGCEPSTYRTARIEPSMLSVNQNKFIKIPIRWLTEHNSRFDKATGRLRDEHRELAVGNLSIAARLGIPTPEGRLDMFVYSTKTQLQTTVYNAASHWGQMDGWALHDHVLDNIGKTSAYQASATLGEYQWRAIEQGKDLITLMRNKTPGALDRVFINTAIGSRPTVAGDTLAPGGTLVGGQTLPTREQLGAPFAAITGYTPYGYGTISGLLTIAQEAATSEEAYGYLAESVRNTAVAFAAAFNKLVRFYRKLYTDAHPAFDERYVPSPYRSSDTGAIGREYNKALAFAYNILDEPRLPVYYVPASAAGGAGGAGGVGTFENIVQLTTPPAGSARTTSPYEGFRGYLPEMLTAGAPLQLQQTFGTVSALQSFEVKFNLSRFADAYKAKLAQDRARIAAAKSAATSGARTLRTTPSSTAATLEDDNAVTLSQAESVFVQFQENEVLSKSLEISEAQRIWANVIDNVLANTTPSPLINADIQAWARSDIGGRATAAALLQSNVPAGAYLTRLSVPYEKLLPELRLASPLNVGQVLAADGASSIAFDALKKSATTDVDLAPIFSTASRGGLRQAIASIPNQDRVMTRPQLGGYAGLSSAAAPIVNAIGRDAIPDAHGTGSTWLVVNASMRRRWLEASQLADIGEHIARKAFMTAPITSQVCNSMADNNVVLPFAHLMLRPFKRYMTECIVYLAMTPQTPIGFTATHDPRVNYFSNGVTEKFFIHVVIYTETINMRPERELIVPDARVSNYEGGDNLEPYSPKTFVAAKISEQPYNGPSVIVVMEPAGSLFGKYSYVAHSGEHSNANEQMFGSVLDIRGYFGAIKSGSTAGRAVRLDGSVMGMPGSHVNAGALAAGIEPRAYGEEYPHYTSALHTNYLYGFGSLRTPGRIRGCKFSSELTWDNTVCLQARQKFCSEFGSTVPTAQIRGVDHFADNSEDGCLARRMGKDNDPYSDIYKELPPLLG